VNQRDLDWLAGLLEGEGCFGTTRNHVKGHIYAYPQIQLRMCDSDVVLRAAGLLEISSVQSYYGRPRRSRFWRFSLTGGRAIAIMKQLEPLMGKRRGAKIRSILERGAYRIS
jgi:hypothetical protein